MLDEKLVSESFALVSNIKPIDLFAEKASRKSKSIVLQGSAIGTEQSFELNVNSWLASASEQLNISPDIRDYVIVPTPVNISGLPNTNGDCFINREWLKWHPKRGMRSFETFRGMPTFVEHNNKDHRAAAGMIFDSFMSPLRHFKGDHSKITLLKAFDRNINPQLCQDILDRKHTTYSIGVWYTAFTCSICGHRFNGQNGFCSHTRLQQPTVSIGDQLSYRICHNLEGFESSAVRDPAFVCASNQAVFDPRRL